MAAPAKSSRWGSFLQQAVAGVEARLDNILAEGENGLSQQAQTPLPATTTAKEQQQQQNATPRSSTSSRTNDRLQERLAKAMASKTVLAAEGRSIVSNSPVAEASADSCSSEAVASRSELNPDPTPVPRPAVPSNNATEGTSGYEAQDAQDDHRKQNTQAIGAVSDAEKPSLTSPPPEPLEALSAPGFLTSNITSSSAHECHQCDMLQAEVDTLRARDKQVVKDQQDEINRHVEQFETLQAKIQFLAQDVTETARNAAAAAPNGSFERKLAERDEKIALLMQEGRGLAATEQKHRSMIRKLKSQTLVDEQALGELRAHLDRTIAELDALRIQATRVDELEQLNQALQISNSGMRDELDALRADLATDKATINKLRKDLQKLTEQANSTVEKANEDALAAEKRRARDLEDTIAALQVEKGLVAERAKNSIAEAEKSAVRAADRVRTVELETQAELQAMEAKLEAMRAQAEEASSGAVGDSQAKLLRQVETLQTQHAIAKENWQGIEASLLARLSSLEGERDDALRRESEMRKKARETATRCKRQDEELQELASKFPNYQRDLENYESRIKVLQRRAENAETALSQARADVEKQQVSRGQKTETDRRPWLEDYNSGSLSRMQSRPDSPLLSVPTRTLSNEVFLLQSVSGKSRKFSTPTSGSGVDGVQEALQQDRHLSRPSVLPGSSNSPGAIPPTPFDLPPDVLPTSASHMGDKDDLFDGVETTSSPRQMMQDMVSVSTVAAGPSVQLVERMSAAIRRLEGEKVTSREELARISAQRDEARAEIVALMKEVEFGKAASRRVAELETQVDNLNSRYQTTLELLGEKSELVEELRADVQDVKAMYRDLVERTVR
ncbi:M protein repeat protein [Colletotrichum musicola]|uniref:M protein repeat protein n=1 Tax=Colletotrichum musicola TaxID=2175873 RepID=A0A8H6MK91_9PEZI|nr:M protein repeat protein [Colletotrichum musicola]